MPIVVMSDPIIVPLPVYYGTSDTRYGRPVFPKTGLFLYLYSLAEQTRSQVSHVFPLNISRSPVFQSGTGRGAALELRQPSQ
jgi:hypothetical protein